MANAGHGFRPFGIWFVRSMTLSVKALAALICVTYVGMRLWRLTEPCLWFDEIFSVHAAAHDWTGLLWFVAQDLIHPPLFYVLLKIWIAIAGEGVLWLRLLPVVFSMAALGVFLQLCRELKLRASTMLLALTFFTVSGSLIKYAQEVRMYNLLLFLSLLSMWAFLKFVERGSRLWLVTLVNILLVYTHYYGWLVVVSELVAAAFLYRRQLRPMLTAIATAVFAFLPWVAIVAYAARSGSDVEQNLGWIERPGPQTLMTFVFDVIEPFYFQMSTAEPTTRLAVTLPLLIVLVGALLFYLIDRRETDRNIKLLAIFAFVPLVLAFGASWMLPVSIWGSRHLIIVFAPMAILISIVVTGIGSQVIRYVMAASLAVIFAVAGGIHARSPSGKFIWCAFEDAAIAVVDETEVDIYAFEDSTAYQIWHAVGKKVRTFRVRSAGVPEDPAFFLPRGFDDIQTINFDDISADRIWIAYRGAEFLTNDALIEGFRSKGYRVAASKVFAADGVNAVIVLLEK